MPAPISLDLGKLVLGLLPRTSTEARLVRPTARRVKDTARAAYTAAKETAGGFYPETKWVVGEGYRGAPYLVKDQNGDTKCVSCQLCEFVCPPKAIRITRAAPVAHAN